MLISDRASKALINASLLQEPRIYKYYIKM
jgi:hypothetical protein